MAETVSLPAYLEFSVINLRHSCKICRFRTTRSGKDRFIFKQPTYMRLILPLLLLTLITNAQKNMSAQLDRFLSAKAAVNGFSGTVLVASKNGPVFKKAYGEADKEWQVRNTIDTRFPIGSMTKQFTAACILLLQERGQLKVSDPVSRYLPDYPKGDSVTIQMLLNHTSGIHELSLDSNFLPDLAFSSITRDSFYHLIRKQSYDFSPGTDWAYCNTGYTILGMIIEKISHEPYYSFLQRNILRPLSMLHTVADDPDTLIMHRALGYYTDDNGRLVHSRHFNPAITFSAGFLVSTVDDLYRWASALMNNKLLSQASFKAMTTAYRSEYGYGLFINRLLGHAQISHGGGDLAYVSNLAIFPDDGITIIILTNTGYSEPFGTTISLAAILFGHEVLLPYVHKPINATGLSLDRFTGSYESDIRIDIRLINNKLYRHKEGTEDIELIPESTHKFFYNDGSDRQIDFVIDKAGRINELLLIESGFVSRLKKKT